MTEESQVPIGNICYNSLPDDKTSHQPSKQMGFLTEGRIELIMGCMFAGKTTELIRRLNKHELTEKKVLRVKFAADKRYGDDTTIVTHGGIKSTAVAVNRLSELGNTYLDFQVIGIDEGQFFEDIDEFAERAAGLGKIVIVSSLQGTFLREAFPKILNLIPKCEKVKKLSAVCKICKK